MVEAGRFDTRMRDEDALLWHIEKDPVLRSTIVAVARLDRRPDWPRMRERFELATLVVPRMRQRVVSAPLRVGPPEWVFDPDFDLEFHLRHLRVPAPGSDRDLLDAINPIVMAPFDRARPLWEFTVLDGLEGDRSAVVLKVHHSVTDGVGGMALLASLVDVERDAPAPTEWPAAPAAPGFSALGLALGSLGHTRRRALGISRRVPGLATRTALGAARDPVHSLWRAADTARSVARIVAPAAAPLSPLMVGRGLRRHLDTLDVPLDDLRRAAKAAGGSLNDAFVAGVVGGLTRYHERHGVHVDRLRTTMPINLRSSEDLTAGNRFAPARFAVPADITDPVTRLRAIGALVREWRAEPAMQLTGAVAGVLNRMPTAATTALFGGMLKCVDFTTTNVPGSPIPIYVGGAAVEGFYAFAPPAGSALNVALVSHVDRCCIGIVSDSRAVPDPDALLDDLRAGLDEVIALG